ncbi:Hypothetical predicted protein [Mytilus galloprovincialis]|uniref:Uncharacterized protein n=1 Tax=Mytilus galloprovincialis TaxID=29158 RepID=A0A8B6BLR7_MYTGA|nr:Hypothetical predicted protein [Mytilus galloprovincialis]
MASKRERQPNWSISEITLLQELRTGGGPAPKPTSAVEEKFIEMMKDKPNFSGISCSFESTMPPVFEIGLVEKAKNMHAEIQSYLENYTERYNLPRANDVHLIPFLEPSVESSYSENQIDELVNFLCSKYPSLQDISSRDISSLIHNIVQFIVNYRQGGTPNGSFVESELDNSQQPCFSARVGDGQTGSVSSMFPESFTSIPRSSTDSTSSIALISLTEEFAVEEDASSSSIAKKPDGKRKRVSLGDLQTMQYEVLEKQRSQADLLTTKLKMEINREKLETKNLKLRNTKLRLEIRMFKTVCSE